MSFVLIDSGTDVFDNLSGLSPLEWTSLLEQSFLIPEGNWFGTGQLQLELQVFYSVTTNQSVAKRNTERFLNPTQSQLGHWAALSDGFVVDDGRLLYNKQAHHYKSTQVQISGTQANARLNLGNTLESKPGHALNLTDFSSCVQVSGLVTPPPTPSQLYGQANTGAGALCMGLHLGQLDLQEKDPFVPGPKNIFLRSRDLLLPDELSGVLWTGHRLEIAWLFGYQGTNSSAVPVAPYQFLSGPLSIPNYNYSCATGNPVPLPGNPPCTPLQLDLSQTGGTGQVTLGCNQTQP